MALDAVSLMRARGARNSILAGARPRDRIRWRRPVRSLAKAACGRGGPYVFKSRHGLLVLGRMARTRADVREAELLEDLADRALVVSDAEALGHDLLPPGASARRHARRAPGRFQRPRRAAPAVPPRGAAGGLSTSCPGALRDPVH